MLTKETNFYPGGTILGPLLAQLIFLHLYYHKAKQLYNAMVYITNRP
jgi:hypothetical protein